MFQAPDLNLIVEFIFMFYKEKPIDWLLDHILWVKVCNPEKDAVLTINNVHLWIWAHMAVRWMGASLFLILQKHCERQKSSLRVRFRPSLFQHVGLHSSLAGKIQKLTVSLIPSQLFISNSNESYFLSRNTDSLCACFCRTKTSWSHCYTRCMSTRLLRFPLQWRYHSKISIPLLCFYVLSSFKE